MEREELARTVIAAQSGDSEALNTLFNAYYNDVYYYALKTVRDEELAAEITHETFIELIETLEKLKIPEAFVTWMIKVAYHQCTKYFKSRDKSRENGVTIVAMEEDPVAIDLYNSRTEEHKEFIPDAALDQKDFRRTIMMMVDDLSVEQRAAVMMYYFEEMSVQDIAEIMEVSEGTVKSRLNYARKNIKASVEDYERKNNIKLHGVAFLPLLKWLFEGLLESTEPVTETVAVAASTGIGAKIASLPFVTKIISGVIATSIVVGGGAVVLSEQIGRIEPSVTVPAPQTETVMYYPAADTAGEAIWIYYSQLAYMTESLYFDSTDELSPDDAVRIAYFFYGNGTETAYSGQYINGILNGVFGRVFDLTELTGKYALYDSTEDIVTITFNEPRLGDITQEQVAIKQNSDGTYSSTIYEYDRLEEGNQIFRRGFTVTVRPMADDRWVWESSVKASVSPDIPVQPGVTVQPRVTVQPSVTVQPNATAQPSVTPGSTGGATEVPMPTVVPLYPTSTPQPTPAPTAIPSGDPIQVNTPVFASAEDAIWTYKTQISNFETPIYFGSPDALSVDEAVRLSFCFVKTYDGENGAMIRDYPGKYFNGVLQRVLGRTYDFTALTGEYATYDQASDTVTVTFDWPESAAVSFGGSDVVRNADGTYTSAFCGYAFENTYSATDGYTRAFRYGVDLTVKQVNDYWILASCLPMDADYYVPEGCRYVSDGKTYYAGAPVPCEPQFGDSFYDEYYRYTYGQKDNPGWFVLLRDKTLTSYGTIKSNINGLNVISIRDLFWNCTQLAVAPDVPDTVTDISNTFSGCINLQTAPAIPASVTNMMHAFNGCKALTGTIRIDAQVASAGIGGCFRETVQSIVLTGSCSLLEDLAATATNGNVTVG